MERRDVAIVGGGLAGSALAAVLSRSGLDVGLHDPHAAYPDVFQAEKLTARQIAALGRLGLDRPALAVATAIDELWIARSGRVVERRANREHGIGYGALVEAVRSQLPAGTMHVGRVAAIEASDDRQRVRLASGETIEARLVVMATGSARNLLAPLGITLQDVASAPAMAIGFDLAGANGAPALTYFGHSTGDRTAYVTVFPIGERSRANLFIYRARDEEWSRRFRADPRGELVAMMPGLPDILGAFTVSGVPVMRPIRFHESRGHRRDGVVLVGDAFATTCPTGGTGLDKVLTDVERLAAMVPGWLATPGMGLSKLARFYDDPVKRACDRNARAVTAYARSMATDPGALWVLRRFRNLHAQKLRNWLRNEMLPRLS